MATPITLNYHTYWLAQKRDGLYNAGGALLARVAAGAASAKVGQEIDVQVTRPLTPQLALAAGYSHLFAGPFLKPFELDLIMVVGLFGHVQGLIFDGNRTPGCKMKPWEPRR